tara:strand:+ start:1172 stop:1480 length:309 start_codon:yes stop_codon:yes gene_type:complete
MAVKRHKYSKIRRDKTGTRLLTSTILPNIPKSNTDIYFYAKVGDRLDLLANQYYGDTSLWWVIAKANNLGKGSLNIVPGTQIRIPQDLQKIYAIMEHKNLKG